MNTMVASSLNVATSSERKLTVTITGESNPEGSGKTQLQFELGRLLEAGGCQVMLEDNTCGKRIFEDSIARLKKFPPVFEPVSVRLVVENVPKDIRAALALLGTKNDWTVMPVGPSSVMAVISDSAVFFGRDKDGVTATERALLALASAYQAQEAAAANGIGTSVRLELGATRYERDGKMYAQCPVCRAEHESGPFKPFKVTSLAGTVIEDYPGEAG